MIVTNNKIYRDKLLSFRNHGITKDSKRLIKKDKAAWYHEMQDIGFNYRMTDIQAALGVSQMKKLNTIIAKRSAVAKRYDQEFRNLKNFILPQRIVGRKSSWHLYTLRVASDKKHIRDGLFKTLQKAGVGVQVHYIPIYEHPYYRSLGYKKGAFPHTELFSYSSISLPIFPLLSIKDQKKVIAVVKSFDKEL